MKGFFVALLALPAILAAPVNDASWPTTFPINTFECCCTDGGERSTSGSCLAMNGAQQYSSEWCYPAVSWAPHMEQVFTDDYCHLNDPTMPKAQCKPIRLCMDTLVNSPDYFQIC